MYMLDKNLLILGEIVVLTTTVATHVSFATTTYIWGCRLAVQVRPESQVREEL